MSETLGQRDRWILDGHKLHLHPERVADFLAGRPVGPLYVELGLTNRCNLQCRYCGLDYCRTTRQHISLTRVDALLPELVEAGTRALCIAGEGEPMLYTGLEHVLRAARAAGLRTAMVSNGTLLNQQLAATCCETLSWIKLSVNAISPATYADIHGVAPAMLDRVMAGLDALATARRQRGGGMTIGVQAILLPENQAELPALAAAVRERGADYLVIKPFTENPQRLGTAYRDLRMALPDDSVARLRAEQRNGFSVIWRRQAATAQQQPAGYGACGGAHFAAFIYADSNVYTCPTHCGNARNCYGNIRQQAFSSVWHSAAAQAIRARLARSCEPNCIPGCRLHAINGYLWALQHPAPHDDFI